jgi:uncharacterized protein YtpQ (UPF0354 family)
MKTDEVIRCALPQFFPENWLDKPGLVFSDFPSCIRLGYVLRGGGNYSFVCEEDFSALSIGLEELHCAAVANLARLPSAEISIAKVAGGTEGWIRATEDNFAAVRILLPDVQEVFRQEIGDHFLITLPHRDDCFCWSPGQAKERQEKHTADALAAFLQERYNLTPDVLLFSQGRFHLHRQQIIA